MINRVAVCFSGFPRLTPETEKTWKNFIHKYNADVFVHTWAINQYIRENISKNIVKALQPKQFIIESSKNFNTSRFQERIWPHKSQPNNVISMWYSIKESIKLCNQYSQNTGILYNIICRARFDWFCSNLELIDAIGLIVPDDPGLSGHHFKYKDRSYIGHNDQFGYGSPKIMNIYADTYDTIPQLYNDGVDFCSELFLTANMISRDIPITYQKNLNYVIVK